MSDIDTTDLKLSQFETNAAMRPKSEEPAAVVVGVDNQAATRQAIIVRLRREGCEFKTRSEWKARAPKKDLEPDWNHHSIALHHAGNSFSCSADGAEQLRRAQEQEMAGIFDDVSYRYAIDGNGVIYEARDIRFKGGHIDTGNSGVVSIVLLADLSRRGLRFLSSCAGATRQNAVDIKWQRTPIFCSIWSQDDRLRSGSDTRDTLRRRDPRVFAAHRCNARALLREVSGPWRPVPALGRSMGVGPRRDRVPLHRTCTRLVRVRGLPGYPPAPSGAYRGRLVPRSRGSGRASGCRPSGCVTSGRSDIRPSRQNACIGLVDFCTQLERDGRARYVEQRSHAAWGLFTLRRTVRASLPGRSASLGSVV
jgi:hypothetical protein